VYHTIIRSSTSSGALSRASQVAQSSAECASQTSSASARGSAYPALAATPTMRSTSRSTSAAVSRSGRHAEMASGAHLRRRTYRDPQRVPAACFESGAEGVRTRSPPACRPIDSSRRLGRRGVRSRTCRCREASNTTDRRRPRRRSTGRRSARRSANELGSRYMQNFSGSRFT